MSDVRIASRAIPWPLGSGVNAYAAGDKVPLETVERLGLEEYVFDPDSSSSSVPSTVTVTNDVDLTN
jgi:hypothetical protein